MKLSKILAAAFAIAISTASWAQPPVPFYTANVTKIDKQSPGSVVITTKDSSEVVCAWYRKNLGNANGEHKTADGAVLFYTQSGATVDVEPGNKFDPGTHIGLVWDAKKFGPYPQK